MKPRQLYSNFTLVEKGNLSKSSKDRIFNKEFLPQMDALYNFAFHLTLDEDDANDLVQETFLKAYRFIDSYQQGTNAKAWLGRRICLAMLLPMREASWISMTSKSSMQGPM